MENESQTVQAERQRKSFFSAVIGELTRRKVLRTVGAYAVAVFAVLQLLDAAAEPLRLPEWLPTFVVVTLILGFPVVFLLAWQLEVTREGIRRTRAAGLLTRAQRGLLFSFMMIATVGLGYGFYQYYSGLFEEAGAAGDAPREFSAPENSIAVLPFADLSADADQSHFADGITEELINLLAQVEGLQVAARTSSFAFREAEKGIREIGRLLNVRAVLEGSVRTSGNRVRLIAQLINVEDGFHIWSHVYDREMSDLFAIQDEIASQIAGALLDSFQGLQVSDASRADNVAAAQAYRTGRLMWWRRTPEDLQRAIELFAEALQHDPTFAPAYAAMADSWLLLSSYGNVTPMEAIEKANPMIERALAMDPNSAEAYAALGLARFDLGQYDAAESALRHSIELKDDYIPARLWLSTLLQELGRYPEQQRVLEAAMAIDPLNELLVLNYAGNLSVRGEWEAARQMFRGMLDLKPDSVILLRFLSEHEILHGELVEGFRLAQQSHALQPHNPLDITALGLAWLNLGALDEAEQVLAEGMSMHPNNVKLQQIYWQLLLAQGRIEEARALPQQLQREAGEQIPAFINKFFNFQLGMISLSEGDPAAASEYLSAAVEASQRGAYDNFELIILTMAALALERDGQPDAAARLMSDAQRQLRRARVNGVDNPDIYYSEAAVLAMNGEVDLALDKLREAYEAGFRVRWLLEIDPRIDTLRGHPEFVAISEKIQQDMSSALEEVRASALASI